MKYSIFLFLIIGTSVIAQKKQPAYFIYDKDWNAAKDIASATYILEQRNIGDTSFVNRIFLGRGHLWKQETFSDADQTIPHGTFAWYDNEGKIDSAGFVFQQKKDGKWTYYDDTLGVYLSIEYEKGREISRRDYINKVIITANGITTFDQEKKGKDSASIKTFKVDEKEAIFKGGAIGFRKYLEKNLVPPTDIVKTGPVKLQFIINKNGKLEHLLILKSLQLSADMEALRVLSDSPDWVPAYQNGKNVIYQAIQYITFQVR